MRAFMVHRNAMRRKATGQTIVAILLGGLCLLATLMLFVLTETSSAAAVTLFAGSISIMAGSIEPNP